MWHHQGTQLLISPSHFYQLWTFTATGRTWCIAESGLLGFFVNVQHPFNWQVQASFILQCAFWFWLLFRRQNHLWKMGWWISADYVFPGFETFNRPTCYCTLCALLSFHSTLNFSPSDSHSRCQMFCVCTVCTVCVWHRFLLLAAASLVQSQSPQLWREQGGGEVLDYKRTRCHSVRSAPLPTSTQGTVSSVFPLPAYHVRFRCSWTRVSYLLEPTSIVLLHSSDTSL